MTSLTRLKFGSLLILPLILLAAIYLGGCDESKFTPTVEAAKTEKFVHPPIPPEMMSNKVLWTCPMHPQVKADGAADCPICGMDLVPMKKVENSAANRTGTMNNHDDCLDCEVDGKKSLKEKSGACCP